MMGRSIVLVFAAAVSFGLGACAEKEQTATTRKPDTQAWAKSDSAFVASGWKEGDKTSWEEQLKVRAAAQNEYARVK
jgi:hypothetical protein